MRKYHDQEWLSEQYSDKGLSQQEIADKCSVHQGTISVWIRKFDLERPWYDEDLLQELYVERGLSSREIAGELGCDKATVFAALGKYGIRAKESNVDKPPAHGYSSQGYERIQHDDGGGTKAFHIHRLVAIAEYGFEKVVENHIHHRNCIPWDNRPSNLEPLSAKDHSELHNSPRLLRKRDPEWSQYSFAR